MEFKKLNVIRVTGFGLTRVIYSGFCYFGCIEKYNSDFESSTC